MKLIKLLYLADRASLLRWGRSITTDQFVSMDPGPGVSRILDLATNGDVPGSPQIWMQHISEPSNYEVEIKQDAGRDELSDVEIGTLDEVFKEHGRKSRWELVDFTHTLPEWTNPNGSAIPIEVRDILRLSGKTELEVRAVEGDLAELSFADFVLRR